MLKKYIEIFTDGSCIGNPGPGGWAALLLEREAKKPFTILKGRESATTNNRMEMIAVIEALRYIHEHHLQNHEITLHSDSNLIIQTLRQGWKRKANLDLWEELDELNEELSVEFVWVRGHHTNKWNNECDKLAQGEAKRAHAANRAAAEHRPQSGSERSEHARTQRSAPMNKRDLRKQIKPGAKRKHHQQKLF